MNHSHTALLPPAFLVAAGLFAGSAWADIINIALTQPNAAISGFPSPYGNVKIDLNAAGTVATITFTADETHANAYTFGDGGIVDLNVNGAYTLGTPTEANTLVGGGFTPIRTIPQAKSTDLGPLISLSITTMALVIRRPASVLP